MRWMAASAALRSSRAFAPPSRARLPASVRSVAERLGRAEPPERLDRLDARPVLAVAAALAARDLLERRDGAA